MCHGVARPAVRWLMTRAPQSRSEGNGRRGWHQRVYECVLSGHAICIIVRRKHHALMRARTSRAEELASYTSKTSSFSVYDQFGCRCRRRGGLEGRRRAPRGHSLPGSSPSGATERRAPPRGQRV